MDLTELYDVANAADSKTKRPCGEELWASRREEILEQAARLFAENGYSDTDTQLLAETLGVGKGTVYRYFPSKRELFLATADRVMRQLCGRVDAAVAGIEEPFDQIRAGIRAFLTFFAEQPAFVELLMQERAQFKDRKKPTIIEHREANCQRWHDMYRALIAQGRIRAMPVEQISNAISHLLYGTIFMNYFRESPRPVDEQTQELITVFFEGILTPCERERQAALAAAGSQSLGSHASANLGAEKLLPRQSVASPPVPGQQGA